MNEITKSQANRLLPAIEEHKLNYAIRDINTKIRLNKTGTYVIFGTADNLIANANNESIERFYENAMYQEKNPDLLFPRCSIIKMSENNPLLSYSDAYDKMIAIEFLDKKCKEYGLTYPNECSYMNVLMAIDYYNFSINPDYTDEVRAAFKKDFELALKFICSGKDIETFFKDEKIDKRLGDPSVKFLKANEYFSTSKNCVTLEKMASVCRKFCTTRIQEKDLPEFEKKMEKYANSVKYHIKPKGFVLRDYGEYIPIYGEDNIFKNDKKGKIYHDIVFDEKDEYIISGIVNELEYPELAKHSKALSFMEDKMMSGVSVPVYNIEALIDCLDELGANYIFDVNGAYIPSTFLSAGILTDNKRDLELLQKAISAVFKSKQNHHIINEEAELAFFGPKNKRDEYLIKMNEKRQQEMDNFYSL